jgi:hypothetical protein
VLPYQPMGRVCRSNLRVLIPRLASPPAWKTFSAWHHDRGMRPKWSLQVFYRETSGKGSRFRSERRRTWATTRNLYAVFVCFVIS